MLAFPAAIKIYVAVQPVDMRKQFNGLWAAAAEQLKEGRFSWPKASSQIKMSLAPEALGMLCSGIDLKRGSMKPWYDRD
jgi:transposase